jgi:hypothetical protein
MLATSAERSVVPKGKTEKFNRKSGKEFHTSFFSVLAKQSSVLLYDESPIILDFT